MHVLLLSTGYPTEYAPLDGIFYRDQADALAGRGVKTGYLSINPISLKTIYKKLIPGFGKAVFKRKGVNTYLYKYINMPLNPDYCINVTLSKGLNLFELYVGDNGLPDILHVHSYHSGLLALKIKEKYNIPFVVTEHSSQFIKDKLTIHHEDIAKRVFNNSDYNIAVSKSFAELMSNKYNNSFNYVPNIVDTDFFIPSKESKEGFSIINVGSLDKNKNHAMLIEAFSEAFKYNDDVKLKIIGGGMNYKNLQNQVKSTGLFGKVTICGPYTRSQIKQELDKSRFFVLSSHHETFGVVLIEAMSMGLPLLSTASGGPQSIVTDSRLGMVCKTTVADLTIGLRYLYENINGYDSTFIRNEALKSYSPQAIGDKLTDIYQEILNRSQYINFAR